MDSLGDYLKHARKKKGISLEGIASKTRIQEHHLQALEAEDFGNLPAKVFVKGFVRSYAKAVELDEDEALQYFLQSSASYYEQSQPDQPQPHMQVKIEADPRQGISWNLVIAVISLIAIGLIWYGYPTQPETPIAQPASEVSPTIEAVEEERPSEPVEETTAVEPAVEVSTSESPPQEIIEPEPEVAAVPTVSTPPPNGETPPVPEPVQATSTQPRTQASPIQVEEPSTADPALNLEIEATQLTWVVVKSDEQPPNEALLQPGQRITWEAEEQFLLTLGNAAGVVVRLNGQAQGPFGKAGQVVRDIRLRP